MKTILIIEDDPTVRASIQDCLEEKGFQTLGAASGNHGLQLSQERLPDLVLCDVQMPGLNGYDVLLTLRQSPTTATIPFIFLTAKGHRDDQRHGMDLGADDYLTKPFSPGDLLRAVGSRLDKSAVVKSHVQQQLDQLRQSIALSLPHEFRTPISGILTAAELLRLSADDPVQVLDLADSIQSTTERLYKLVQHFLLYADLEIAAHNPQPDASSHYGRTVDPRPAIRAIATKIAKAADRAADLHFDLQPLAIAIAEIKLLKLIEVLVDNAFKFSEPGTPVQVSSTITPNGLQMQIGNQGRGMTPEQIVNLGAYMQFDRRLHEQQGSGLGLIIAKRIAELHGGSLTIQSLPGAQTTVQVVIPKAE